MIPLFILTSFIATFTVARLTFAISRPLVDVAVVSRRTVTRFTFDLPGCREPLLKTKKKEKKRKQK